MIAFSFRFILITLLLVFSTLSFQPTFVFAQPEGDPLGLTYGEKTGLGKEDIRITAARIINVTLGLLGIISVALIVFAGFKWMTSAGNEEAIESAKQILWGSVIGLLLIASAYTISRFALESVYEATTNSVYVE